MAHPLPLNNASCDGLLYCLSSWANNVTNNLFFVFITIAFGVVLFMATNRFGTQRAFGFAGISVLFVSIWLATLQLMSWWIASIFVIIGIISIVILIMKER